MGEPNEFDDEDIYEEEGMEEAMDSDEIDELEEGFLKGYKDEDMAKCAFCGNILLGPDQIVERDINGHNKKFCSERCAEQYEIKYNDV